MIKAVVLDIGGVILRTEDRSGRLALEEKYGLPTGGADALVFNSQVAKDSTVGLIGQHQVWDYVSEQLSLTHEELDEFQHKFWLGDQIDKELINFLIDLHQDFKTALLSNAWVGARDTFAKQFQLIEGETADRFLISSELGVAKPNERIYQILAETLNVQFNRILFVDDFIENINAANQLGIQTIHYQPGIDLISQIKKRLSLD